MNNFQSTKYQLIWSSNHLTRRRSQDDPFAAGPAIFLENLYSIKLNKNKLIEFQRIWKLILPNKKKTILTNKYHK